MPRPASSFENPALLLKRIAAKTERTDGCWNWKGALFGGEAIGYGVTVVSGKNLLTHRVVWQLHYGPVPDGLLVCHRCDNRRCVRPTHLFLGTYADNSADMVTKKRSARGERVNLAKLTEADVRQIRAAYIPKSEGGYGTVVALAERFGVHRTCIHAIVHRKTWRHVE